MLASYLVDQKYILPPDEELALASLCLEYLSFPCFNTSASDQEITRHIWKGSYAFMDYAAVHWPGHLLESTNERDLDTARILRLSMLLERFLKEHWSGSEASSPDTGVVQDQLSCFAEYPFHDRLAHAIKAMSALAGTRRSKTFKDPLNLMKHLWRVRALLEAITATDSCRGSMKALLASFYGRNLFKCSRPNCLYFHQGFQNRHERDRHHAKHEKPFLCTYTGCPIAVLGCNTARELENHVSSYHTSTQNEWKFPVASRPKPLTLNEAASKGDLATVESFIDEARDNLRSKQRGKWCFIGDAVINGHEHIVKRFDKELRYLYSNDHAFLARKAICHKRDSIALFLVSLNPYAGQVNGRNLLSIAAEYGRDVIARELISHYRVNPDEADHRGRTPISWAAERGNDSVVRLLIDSKCNFHLRSKRGELPVSYAARNGHESTVRLLSPQGSNENSEWVGAALLYQAVRSGDYALVQRLLEIDGLDPNLNCSNGDRDTPLLTAIKGNDDLMVETLIKSPKVDVNRQQAAGCRHTPLMLATQNGFESIAKLLLKVKSINVTTALRNGHRDTALMLATRKGSESIVELLLKAKYIDLIPQNSRYYEGARQALDLASRNKNVLIAQLLRTAISEVNTNKPKEKQPSSYFDEQPECIIANELNWNKVSLPPLRMDLNIGTSILFWRRFYSLPPEAQVQFLEFWNEGSDQLHSVTVQNLQMMDYLETSNQTPWLEYESAYDSAVTENPWADEGDAEALQSYTDNVVPGSMPSRWLESTSLDQWQVPPESSYFGEEVGEAARNIWGSSETLG